MDEFESLLAQHINAVERFVRFRIGSKADADDVLGEVYLAAYRNFPGLRDKDAFKGWIISIARNKCNDYFRRKAACCEIPIDKLIVKETAYGRCGVSAVDTVRDTLSLLGDKDKQILYLFFWKEMPQAEIARLLDIPVGTVKSRLHTAKHNFKNKYPYPPKTKGESDMKKLPEFMPEYTIKSIESPEFPVVFEELSNWFIIPRTGEEVIWASYDMPSRKMTEQAHSTVVCPAVIHGVEGVEISTKFNNYGSDYGENATHIYYAQLTETHCRWLGESYTDKNGVKRLLTFLDGDDFISEWGYGEDNCGNETHLKPSEIIIRTENTITVHHDKTVIDIVGRYLVKISDREYDTVCMMEWFDDGALTEQFLDRNGRTILWRRFNRDDWAIDRYKKKWSELLPENERLTVNGTTYVHWYDCISDYIL